MTAGQGVHTGAMHPFRVVVVGTLLVALGTGQDNVAALVRDLGSPTAASRSSACVALAALGPKAAPAIPALSQALADELPEVRRAAGRALGKVGKAAIPRIKAALGDTSRASGAALAVGELGAEGASLVPEMLAIFQRGEGGSELSDNVTAACVAIGAPALPHLQKGMKRRGISGRCAEILRSMGEAAAPAAPALLELALDNTELPGARIPAFEALHAIGKAARAQAPKLLAFVCDGKQGVDMRGQAASALARIGHDDPAAASKALQPFANDPDEGFRKRVRAAIDALK